MEITPGLFARYHSSNVLPVERVRSSPSAGTFVARAGAFTYSPASVDPLQASGGFNSVIELAATSCRQQAARAIRPVPLDRSISAAALTTLLNAAPAGGRLALVPTATALLTEQDYRGFRLTLTLAGLTFADSENVILSFAVSLSFVHQAASLPEVPTDTEKEFWDPSWVMQNTGTIPVFRPMAPGLRSPAAEEVAPKTARAAEGGRRFLEVQLGDQPLPSEQDLRGVLIGSFSAELRAPLIHRDEASRCATRVFADLRRATWTESLPVRPAAGQPANEVLLVYDALFSNWKSDATALLNAPLDLPLTPTLSLVGPNPGGASVPEITDFAVLAFAVFDPSGFEPVLAVTFDVMPGCHGIIEDVRHFIGPNPYGLVSDEFVVDSVFRHRWNRGGFDRRIEVQAPIQVMVTRNGNPQLEDAVAFGHQDLLTLDHAAITTNSNMRTDCIAFGGQAQSVATSVRLTADGQTFNASQVDLGTPEPTRWGVNGVVGANATWAADPEVRDFQVKAMRDGAQPITLPFAFVDQSNPPKVTYARIEGVTKYVLFLGNLPAVMN